MNKFTTQQQLTPHNILTSLAQLDSLYFAGNLQAYEQTWLEVTQQIEQTLPGFTLAYAEISNAGEEREPLGSMRHVLLPLPDGKILVYW